MSALFHALPAAPAALSVFLVPIASAGTVTSSPEAPAGPEVLQSHGGGTDRLNLARHLTAGGAKAVHQLGGQAFTHEEDFTLSSITFEALHDTAVFAPGTTLTLYVVSAGDDGTLRAEPHTAIVFDLGDASFTAGEFISFVLTDEESRALGTLGADRLHLAQFDFDTQSEDGSNQLLTAGTNRSQDPAGADAYPGGDATFANDPAAVPAPNQVRRLDHNFYLQGVVAGGTADAP